MLSPEETQRYARQTLLKEIGTEGQEKLKQASILLIGTGGLGSPAATYLAAAGVGRMTLIDDDSVELSNLHRQPIHDSDQVGQPKLDSARRRLLAINPHLELTTHQGRFTAGNALELLAPHDLILDGSDNFPTRFAANDAAFFLKKPLIHGAIFQFDGQLTTFAPHLGGPCYRCLLPEPPPPGAVPSCAEAGVLGVLPGIIGSLQAMEALKFLLDLGTQPLGRLIHYQALSSSFRELKIKPDPNCPLCGQNPSITAPISYEHSCSMNDYKEISTNDLRDILTQGTDAILIDVREQEEYDLDHIPGSRLIPLSTWPATIEHLDKNASYLVHCQKGMRSARACQYMLANGFQDATNIAGGMDAWNS
ncbi:MAG: molybdopterin-synthase adenylyltransferase MoeB [Verrucomicrobiales bacterium]